MIIAGIGTAVPPHTIEQSAAFEIMKVLSPIEPHQSRLSRAVYHNSGVSTRHCVILDQSEGEHADRQQFFTEQEPTTLDRMKKYEVSAIPMALESCGMAFEKSGRLPSEITHLVTVSCTGFFSPGVDLAIIKHFGISPEVARTNVGFMGCHGLFNGLRVAQAFIEADPSAKVLICALELCSLHHQYEWTTDNMVANALFADGSAAIVAESSVRNDNPDDHYKLIKTGSYVFQDTEFAMSWRIGDHGFEMTLSAETPRLIHEHLRPWLEKWLSEQGLAIKDVGSWAVHPGGPRILKAFAESIDLPIEGVASSFHILNHYGNMSSPTIAFVMNHLKESGAAKPCVAIGFGPGLVTEAALFF